MQLQSSGELPKVFAYPVGAAIPTGNDMALRAQRYAGFFRRFFARVFDCVIGLIAAIVTLVILNSATGIQLYEHRTHGGTSKTRFGG